MSEKVDEILMRAIVARTNVELKRLFAVSLMHTALSAFLESVMPRPLVGVAAAPLIALARYHEYKALRPDEQNNVKVFSDPDGKKVVMVNPATGVALRVFHSREGIRAVHGFLSARRILFSDGVEAEVDKLFRSVSIGFERLKLAEHRPVEYMIQLVPYVRNTVMKIEESIEKVRAGVGE